MRNGRYNKPYKRSCAIALERNSHANTKPNNDDPERFHRTRFAKKEVLKKQLKDSELENIESPLYIIWNVAAIIIGF